MVSLFLVDNSRDNTELTAGKEIDEAGVIISSKMKTPKETLPLFIIISIRLALIFMLSFQVYE